MVWPPFYGSQLCILRVQKSSLQFRSAAVPCCQKEGIAVTLDALISIPKEDIPTTAEALDSADIDALVKLLDEKADAPRYQALLLLSGRSEHHPDVLPYWARFIEKLSNENSYQRSIGILLLAANARWAKASQIDECLPLCLRLICDEKPITARQAISSLAEIARSQPSCALPVARALAEHDVFSVRESMRKSILLDICRALVKLRRLPGIQTIADERLMDALSDESLDKASKREIRGAMEA